jgi:dTDP-4-amino-4,6-dideoxygalactose transaminase
LSFGGSKLIASGRGGAVITNDSRFAQRMTVFCERGNDAFALSELQAAVILPQYKYLAIDHELRLMAATTLMAQLTKFEWLSSGPLQGMKQPGFYKLGIMVRDSLWNSARAREILQDNTGSSLVSQMDAREFVLRSLSADKLEIGPGFKGFVRRSANRCRQPVALTNSRVAAERTLVLHHSHLLDPQTGLSSIDQVVAAFQSIHREITS